MENEPTNFQERGKNFFSFHWKGVLTVLVPIIFLPILLHDFEDKAFRCVYLVCIMAIYWVTEAIPLAVTSLLPVFAFPLMGILTSEEVCRAYFPNTIVMFIGGLIIALAIEYCNLHKRLALKVILIVGCGPRRLHFGIIFVAMALSMWNSNSATTAMMCPIIRAVLEELEEQKVISIYMDEKIEPAEDGKKHPSKIALAYYLGAAYATTIGGCGTLIGTGTNLTFTGIYDTAFPDAKERITFPNFMAYAVPLVLLDTAFLYFIFQFTHMGFMRPESAEGKEIATADKSSGMVQEIIQQRYKELGPISCHEIQVIILFFVMIILLFTQRPEFVPGWGDFFNEKKIKNSLAMILVVILLFFLPINYTFFKFCGGGGPFPGKQIPSLMVWGYLNKNIPWGLLFLLGGGFALAEGSKQSGMAKMIGTGLKDLGELPFLLLLFLVIVTSIFMTAFSSNVAIANIIIPVLCEMSKAIKQHPLNLVIPAGLSCSFAFHLPVSTPPNAIVAGYANIKTKYMAVAGIGPTVVTIILLLINSSTWHYVIFPESRSYPDWIEED